MVGATLLGGGARSAYESQSVPLLEYEHDGARSGFDAAGLMQVFTDAVTNSTNEQDARAAIGAYARAVPRSTMPDDDMVAMVRTQLPSLEWPERDLRVTAVDATDGSFVVFDKSSGVELARAIMASCSVPGVGPTTLMDEREFMDGGMRSGTNADVADGYDRVLVIACNREPEARRPQLSPRPSQRSGADL